MKTISKIALALLLTVGITSCGNSDKDTTSNEKADTNTTIKVGLVGEKNEVWEEVQKRYEEKTGNKLELVVFTDYVQPNEALQNGEIDINSFQHKKYLEEYNKDHNSDLVSIGNTMLAPIGLYSNKIKDVKEIKENDKIAIPNDPTNGSRALFLLEKAGLIKVKGESGQSITIDDITENKLDLEIIELDASETPRSLEDVTAAVVNDNYALDAGLKPNKDAFFLEDANSEEVSQYINVVAARKEDENNKVLKDLVENFYQTDETAKDYDKYTDGAWIPAWWKIV